MTENRLELSPGSKESATRRVCTRCKVSANDSRKPIARGVNSIREPTRTSRGSDKRSRSLFSAWLAAGWDSPIFRAARPTCASDISASSATSRFRSTEAKFVIQIANISSIDWTDQSLALQNRSRGDPVGNGKVQLSLERRDRRKMGRLLCKNRI